MPQSIKVVAIVFVLLGGMIGFDSAQSDDGTLLPSKGFAAASIDRKAVLNPAFTSY